MYAHSMPHLNASRDVLMASTIHARSIRKLNATTPTSAAMTGNTNRPVWSGVGVYEWMSGKKECKVNTFVARELVVLAMQDEVCCDCLRRVGVGHKVEHVAVQQVLRQTPGQHSKGKEQSEDRRRYRCIRVAQAVQNWGRC